MWDKAKGEPPRAVSDTLPGRGAELGSKIDEKKI